MTVYTVDEISNRVSLNDYSIKLQLENKKIQICHFDSHIFLSKFKIIYYSKEIAWLIVKFVFKKFYIVNLEESFIEIAYYLIRTLKSNMHGLSSQQMTPYLVRILHISKIEVENIYVIQYIQGNSLITGQFLVQNIEIYPK